ncbi:MAG: prolipoprotein diacylglyceryl transferase family protein [Candidatus Limnocylindrales bacterium]
MTLAFDPTVRVGIFAVRWETLGLAATVFVALLVAAFAAWAESRRTGLARLRLDDLLFLALAAVAGAVVGGRLVQGFDYLDYYRAHPAALIDPSQGTLSLLGAVLGGTLAVAYMCRLLQVSAGRWLDAAAIPLLLAIGLGKGAYLLGGGGQGLPYNGPLALAFTGPGPWLSPQPAVLAYPSQLLEATWALLGIPLVLTLGLGRVQQRLPVRLRQTGAWLAQRSARGVEVDPERLRFGYRFLAALAWWLAGRTLVAFTWRDPAVLAALDAEQVAALVVLAGVVLVGAWWSRAD